MDVQEFWNGLCELTDIHGTKGNSIISDAEIADILVRFSDYECENPNGTINVYLLSTKQLITLVYSCGDTIEVQRYPREKIVSIKTDYYKAADTACQNRFSRVHLVRMYVKMAWGEEIIIKKPSKCARAIHAKWFQDFVKVLESNIN